MRCYPVLLLASLLAGCPQPDPDPKCMADVQNDPQNCGACGTACATPLNAAALCRVGQCARGPCAAGFFDVDGAQTFGCEATCSGRQCTGPQGTVTLTVPPLPESGAALQLFASGASLSEVQTGPSHTNLGVLGDAPGAGGAAAMQGETHRHVGVVIPVP